MTIQPWASPEIKRLETLPKLGRQALVPAPSPLPKWIIGDTHFGHDNIVRYCNRPSNHDQLMQDRWQETVGPDDTVLHVGDVYLGSERLDTVLGLPGRIYLMPGNHDSRSKQSVLAAVGWTIIGPFCFEHRGWFVVVTHRPISPILPDTMNIHGHIHEKFAPSPQHINVSVEAIDYRPVCLLEIVERAMEANS